MTPAYRALLEKQIVEARFLADLAWDWDPSRKYYWPGLTLTEAKMFCLFMLADSA